METIKSKVFNYLSGSQKSELCHYISKFVKKHFGKSTEEIADFFIEEEQYYLDLDSSRHPWIVDHLDDEGFYKDIRLCIKDNQKKCEIKEKQKPFVEKAKAIQKEMRHQAREWKMSKEPPTKSQVSYYKALCKKFGIKPDFDAEQSSKLALVKAISFMLDKEHLGEKTEILAKLNEIIRTKEE